MDKPRIKPLCPQGDAGKWLVTVSANGREMSGIAMLSNCELVVGRLGPYAIWHKICRKVKELERDLNV